MARFDGARNFSFQLSDALYVDVRFDSGQGTDPPACVPQQASERPSMGHKSTPAEAGAVTCGD